MPARALCSGPANLGEHDTGMRHIHLEVCKVHQRSAHTGYSTHNGIAQKPSRTSSSITVAVTLVQGQYMTTNQTLLTYAQDTLEEAALRESRRLRLHAITSNLMSHVR
jgi:hypothetical protein